MHIVVIGDVMLDRHISCLITGFSQEDDLCPKLKVTNTVQKLGGAGNVAANLKSLGCDNVSLFGVVGDNDYEADDFYKLIPNNINNYVKKSKRYTTVKTRYITPHGRHVARIDREDTHPIDNNIINKWITSIDNIKPDIIIISDYAKGVVSNYLMSKLIGHKIIVDPKNDDFNIYGKVFAITPNEVEENKAWHHNGILVHSAEYIIITKGANGCELKSVEHSVNIPVRSRGIGDSTGCGDSFIAGLAISVADNIDITTACSNACAAGACAVDHKGTHAVTKEEWFREISDMKFFI